MAQEFHPVKANWTQANFLCPVPLFHAHHSHVQRCISTSYLHSYLQQQLLSTNSSMWQLHVGLQMFVVTALNFCAGLFVSFSLEQLIDWFLNHLPSAKELIVHFWWRILPEVARRFEWYQSSRVSTPVLLLRSAGYLLQTKSWEPKLELTTLKP